MNFAAKSIPGVYEIAFPVHRDQRGSFVKPFLRSEFARQGLMTDFTEVFYTVSGERVLRGMHLQLPPGAQAKLVYCAAGDAFDVLLDLRLGSPTYGEYEFVELKGESGNALYLPPGVAHGFYVRQAPVMMVYHVTSEYEPSLDGGISWNSFGAEWPDLSPIISARDAALPAFGDFETPFRYSENERLQSK
jgi:dTDP-4-dehydrorhamnose 3,5-epimerase